MPMMEKPIIKKVLPIFWIQDTSKAIDHVRSACINEALRAFIDVQCERLHIWPDTEIAFVALSVNETAEWRWTGLRLMADVMWEDLSPKQTGFDLSISLTEISNALSYDGFLEKGKPYYRPIIIWCMAAGEITDNNYEIILRKLESNPWYRNALKVAILIGDVDLKIIRQLVKTDEAILRANDLELLKDFIRPIDMPEDWMVEEREKTKPYEKEQFEYYIDLPSRKNIQLNNTEEITIIHRCELMRCEPELAQDAMIAFALLDNGILCATNLSDENVYIRLRLSKGYVLNTEYDITKEIMITGEHVVVSFPESSNHINIANSNKSECYVTVPLGSEPVEIHSNADLVFRGRTDIPSIRIAINDGQKIDPETDGWDNDGW